MFSNVVVKIKINESKNKKEARQRETVRTPFALKLVQGNGMKHHVVVVLLHLIFALPLQ